MRKGCNEINQTSLPSQLYQGADNLLVEEATSGDTLEVVNTFLNPDWGLQVRDPISNSLTRLKNLKARGGEAHGKIDAAKLREIFDIPLFNEDGTFKENGGVTKPKKQDADLTNHQTVTDLSNLEMWIKLPAQKTDWRYVDLKTLFN